MMTVPLTSTQIKQGRRAAKEAALAAKQLALPDKRYGVIVADPPWRWEPYSRETGMVGRRIITIPQAELKR